MTAVSSTFGSGAVVPPQWGGQASPFMEPTKAPWVKPGVVVHDPGQPVDGLLAEFALTIRSRGFQVAGFVQGNHHGHADKTQPIELLDLASGQRSTMEREAGLNDLPWFTATQSSLRQAMKNDADLMVVSRFSALEKASTELKARVEDGISDGMPVLTSIASSCLGKWRAFAGPRGTMIEPELDALWRWWGADRLYRDLTLGVAHSEVLRLICGPRWLMIEGPDGAGLAYLPKFPKSLLPRLDAMRQMSLRQLAEYSQSWDPLEMAVGIAAINAHYNRFDLAATRGNGTRAFQGENGRVIVVGAFPGLKATLPNALVIESEPRDGEYPTAAIDTLMPGCAAAVVTSSALINRSLPRILTGAWGARVALIGPATPMTPRLYDYGVELLGGLVVRDPAGLAAAVEGGALPRDFDRFGHYAHIRRHR